MSNGISDMFERGFEAIRGFGENIGKARYKTGEALSTERQEQLLDEIRLEEKQKYLDQGYSEEDAFDLANQAAREKVQKLVDNELTLFGELTKPKSLLTGLGIAAAVMAGRESQRRYDDYMKNRPKYDPGQNPFMADGGGIQAFADGNKVEPIGQQKLSEMMIMNLKEKPTSTMIKLMTAIDSPEILAAFLGMNQGGGIQGFAKGTPEFPRMTGNIEGPGTGTSDSIPAMLSDGEHVLTKQEVTQIGGGDNDLGHQRLYSMRQDLRSKARSNGIGRM
jgi:uncharacterized protein YjgD (DUF1641 family)